MCITQTHYKRWGMKNVGLEIRSCNICFWALTFDNTNDGRVNYIQSNGTTRKIQSPKRVFVSLLHAYHYNWCRFFESNQNNARKWSNLANHHNIVHVMYIIIRRFSNSIRPALILSFILSLATVTISKADSKTRH